MKKRMLVFGISALLFVVASGCRQSQTVPSEQDGEKVWHNVSRARGYEKDVELVSFKKTNGQFEDANSYTLFFEAKERYLTNRLKRQGEVSTVQARYTFTRTEKGWLGPDQQVY